MEHSSLGRLIGALVSPAKTFRSLAERPTWALALLALVVLPAIPALMALPKFDWEAMAEAQFERMGQEPSAAEREQAVEMMEMVGPISTYSTPVFLAIFFLLATLALWGAFSLAGGEVRFRQTWATTLHAFLPLAVAALLSIPVVLTMGSVGPDDIRSGGYLASSAAAFAPEDASPVLLALLSSLDVFTVWTVVLLVIGFSAAAAVSRATATTTVLVLWALLIAVKVGFAALGSLFGGG